MKIVVTGAAGFVGSHLMPAGRLAGHEMVALGRAQVDFEARPAEVTKALAAILRQEMPDALIHLAGPPPDAGWEQCERICVSGAKALISAMADAAPEARLVAAGSASEVGAFDEPHPCVTESVEANPSSPYGEGKLRQSEAMLAAGGVTMRLFNSTGPGQSDKLVAGRVVAQIASGAERISIRETASVRDFLDVRDAVQAFLMAAESLPPRRFNIASGRATSIGELITIACSAAGAEGTAVDVEFPYAKGNHLCGDPGLLESFGWQRRFSLEETLRDAVLHARNQAAL